MQFWIGAKKLSNMSKKSLGSLLNLDQCKEIVNKFNQENNNNLQVESFTVALAAEAKGFLAEYYHLTIQCNNATELNVDNSPDKNDATLLRFFVKTLPPVNEEHEEVAIFSKESSLYASLLPKLQKYSSSPWCPYVYLCNKNIIVLEDLNSRGFYSLASKDNLKENEMFPVLNGLAAMHASSLVYEFETNNNIEDTHKESLKEITVHPNIPWFNIGIQAILEIANYYSKYKTNELQKFITSELPLHLKSVCVMVNPSLKYRNVLCHRDTWGGNIFLNQSKPFKPAMFVDFQTCRYSPAAIDVIFTLFMNLSKQERLEKQHEYIKYYYNQLVQHVTTQTSSDKSSNGIVFSVEEFFKSIEEFMLFGFVYRALAITILKVPIEFVTDYYKNEERSKILLQYMEENQEFCRLMKESIDDIIGAVMNISVIENN